PAPEVARCRQPRPLRAVAPAPGLCAVPVRAAAGDRAGLEDARDAPALPDDDRRRVRAGRRGGEVVPEEGECGARKRRRAGVGPGTDGGRMISGRDIVCLSFVAWTDHWGTPQQWMSRLAHENRVFFVDQPVSPLSLVTGIRRRDAVLRQFRRWRRGPQEVAPNVWQAAPPPVLPFRFNAVV